MALIKCKEKKKYNLTIGKEYEAALVEGDFYSLINDRGAKAKYSVDLFDVVRADVVLPAPANINRPLPEFNILKFSIGCEDGSYNMSYFDAEADIDVEVGGNFNLEDSTISCGITQANGINYFLGSIEELVGKLRGEFIVSDEEESTIVKLCVTALEEDLRGQNVAIVLLSTNRESALIEKFDSSFTGLIGPMVSNPNSGNQIRLYTFYIGQID